MPIAAWVGVTVMTRLVATIEPIEKSITPLRPARSAIRPKTTAPSGRAAKPTAKTASADMVEDRGLEEGKNCGPMEEASRP